MQLIPVDSIYSAKLFLEVPVRLYKDDPNWIRPLDNDISDIFDARRNKALRTGAAMRWVLLDEWEKPIGRIAAFVNKKYRNKGDDVPVGGMGFFDCIDNQDAADLMFDCARHWLIQQGMEAMDGPINFGERDRWWGLVTEGFGEPLYGMNYNFPYYARLFEDYGFKSYYKQICFGLDPLKPLSPKLKERHLSLSADPGFSARHIRQGQVNKFSEDFVAVYNKAWAGHGGLKEVSKDHVLLMLKKMRPVMDERIIWFAYYRNVPVAMFVNLPDLNQWFRRFDGQFGLVQKIKFLWLKKYFPNRKCTGLVFGIVPEWQGKGVDAYIIGEAARQFMQTSKSPYTSYEMQWIGDFNPKMLNVAEGLGETFRSRELTTYRYLFDRAKEFKKHPILI